jgi:integrase
MWYFLCIFASMKVAFYLKRPDAETETAIFARISFDGNQLKYYTSEKINPKFWNKDARRVKETQKFREYPEFNARLEGITTTIKNVYRRFRNNSNNEVPSTQKLKELIDKELKHDGVESETGTLFSFMEVLIRQSNDKVRLQPKTGKPYSKSTVQTYTTLLNHLKEYQKQKNKRVNFDTIDLNFYYDFTEYLIRQHNMSTNAIGKYFKILKMVMSEGLDRGKHTNIAFKLKRFATMREDSTAIYLTWDEIGEIEKIDLSQNDRLDRVRDLFLIGCHTGLRYSDYSLLRSAHIKDGYIQITQVKTGDPVTIPLHPAVERIIAKYDGELPKAISNQKSNDYLKELGEKLESLHTPFSKKITKGGVTTITSQPKYEALTTHTARRSFATNAYKDGIPTITIMALTGHKTEKSFLRYIKLNSKEHAEIVKLHWDKKNKLKAV